MMSKKFQITEEGLKTYQEELKHLKTVEREKNIIALQEARAQGDLSENADYDVARDEQAKIASRINEIEEILRNYEIIKDNETNNLGKWVQLEILDGEDAGITEEYKIVGSLEADPIRGLISNVSPLGHAIINHKIGDVVEVKPENGEKYHVRILKVFQK
ncbi:MAG TPA: transcription elongation factor GreA [Acholeplasmataceae bacterium]|nr:transcription elongation factor GreA [Acholeplasmataceae bacterium]